MSMGLSCVTFDDKANLWQNIKRKLSKLMILIFELNTQSVDNMLMTLLKSRTISMQIFFLLFKSPLELVVTELLHYFATNKIKTSTVLGQ